MTSGTPEARGALGIYIHLPFCPYLCPYCDFAKWPVRASAAQRYLQALSSEIERYPARAAATMFLGGGTPNSYDARAVGALVTGLHERFGGAGATPSVVETSIEINPELVREGDFESYVRSGITRVSIGVQSFVPDEIRTLGRKHTAEQVAGVVAAARAAGIASLSLDLIFAVPGQTAESWRESLQRAVALEVDHISLYGLTVEPETPYASWHAREPERFFDDAREAELFEIGMSLLERAGYEHYEISNFARSGHRCAHNENYWRNGEYLGLGVGAASYLNGERRTNTRSLATYLEAALGGAPIPFEGERLEGPRRAGEAIMLALRTAQGVRLAEFKERYGIDVLAHYRPVVQKYADLGLLEQRGDSMRLTRRGRFVANDVCGAFVTFD